MKLPVLLAAALLTPLAAFAAAPAIAVTAPTLTLNVWPGTPPGDKPDLKADEQMKPGNLLTGTVATPTLAVYRPAKEKDTGASVLICPGGGFYQLSMVDEGAGVATWLQSIGVTGVLLKYRIPNRDGMPRYMAGLQDAQRAMSIIRSKAAEWSLDPKRVGILGFSAGGQIAADVETNFDKRMYEPVDAMDQPGTRPDFAIVVYPGGIAQRGSDVPALSSDVRVTKDTPPNFLSISNDDKGGSENAVYLYLALKKAGVPAELHVWGEGGHGYGIRPANAPHADWPARAAAWMANRGLLKPAASAP
jgi:acetyl esterase/lipase